MLSVLLYRCELPRPVSVVPFMHVDTPTVIDYALNYASEMMWVGVGERRNMFCPQHTAHLALLKAGVHAS